jgi:nucleoside-diphosphate-sugar epimerase
MKVLVIGGQGYIGSYLVPYLTENNILTTYYGSKELDYNKLDKSYLEVYTHIIIHF